ncbi:hypothetical protein Lrub_1092 [Legionella rubrilucens]|uniref:Uncharacterized protein n=1 Tax=Legionella rubrilucens TaxID=458 RepID=A0A0W0XVT6_9GAMM|nr:hypothetical protein [Legionella rubrilucens]KTD48741.1 hypothetical protein Lrub_1092 [Legionella rubrilucens]
MALSPQADLERFSLLEQLASEPKHEHALRELLAAPTTHPLLRQYFTLQLEKKKIENDFFALPQRESQKAVYEKKLNQVKEKVDDLFSRFQNQEAVLVQVLRAHLLIDASAKTDGSWVLNAAEGDFDYKKKALPILQTLKERGIGVAYRLEGELFNEEADKRENFQRGAQLNDSTAKVFAGYDYLAYIKDEALSDKSYHYPGKVEPDTLLHELKQEIAKGNPVAVVKELTYLDNVVNALKDLDPERVTKNKGTFNQGFYDKKLQEILSSAEKIVSDKQLSDTLMAIKKALASYNYEEVRKQKAALAEYLQTFNRREMERVNTTIHQIHMKPLVENNFKNNVHILHNYYAEEIDRIQQKAGKKLSKGDQKNIETLRIAQKELVDNYELKTDQQQFMANHVTATETALARLSHSNPIVRRIEAIFSAFKPVELGKSRQAFRERFASMKERLHALQEDNKSPESSIHP